jgi:hypothetical protein
MLSTETASLATQEKVNTIKPAHLEKALATLEYDDYVADSKTVSADRMLLCSVHQPFFVEFGVCFCLSFVAGDANFLR